MNTGRGLSATQRAHYDAVGYLAPIDALGAAETRERQRRLAALLAPTGGRPDLRLRNSPHLLLRWMAELVSDARVLDPVADTLGADVLVLRSVLFVKPPGDPGHIAWHQDLAYWGLSDEERVVTAWIALTDSTAANGCMRVVPGSHRRTLLAHRLGRDRHNRLLRGQTSVLEVGPEQVACIELRAGQLSLHHGRLLHSSPTNPSSELRAGLAVRYIAPSVRQRGPRQGALLVRGSDAFGHYDHQAAPRFDGDPLARAWHRRALRRYAAQVVWQALRRPSPHGLAMLARLAVRPGALRVLVNGDARQP